jgi:putative hydrolase of the HAD superfamily
MNQVPTGLLLDFGNVISYSLFETHRATERMLGLPVGSLNWLGPLDPQSDALWNSMQRDEISERDYWAQRALELGRACGEEGWDMLTLQRRVRHPAPEALIRPEVRALVAAAKQRGIKVGILSNELELFHGKPFLEQLEIMSDIAVLIDGSYSHILKPSRAAYDAAIAAMDLPAARLLFVDDQFRNIAGAQFAGLQTQYFDLRDPAGCIAAIAARLRLPMETVK